MLHGMRKVNMESLWIFPFKTERKKEGKGGEGRRGEERGGEGRGGEGRERKGKEIDLTCIFLLPNRRSQITKFLSWKYLTMG